MTARVVDQVTFATTNAVNTITITIIATTTTTATTTAAIAIAIAIAITIATTTTAATDHQVAQLLKGAMESVYSQSLELVIDSARTANAAGNAAKAANAYAAQIHAEDSQRWRWRVWLWSWPWSWWNGGAPRESDGLMAELYRLREEHARLESVAAAAAEAEQALLRASPYDARVRIAVAAGLHDVLPSVLNSEQAELILTKAVDRALGAFFRADEMNQAVDYLLSQHRLNMRCVARWRSTLYQRYQLGTGRLVANREELTPLRMNLVLHLS